MSSKYFYVITRDGQIIETTYSEDKIMGSMKAVRDKGILTFKEEGSIINGADISKILNEDQYENYISTVKPKEYIKNGTWYDGKEGKFLRNEKWKQEKIDRENQARKQITSNISDKDKPITFSEFIRRQPEREEQLIGIFGKEKFERMKQTNIITHV